MKKLLSLVLLSIAGICSAQTVVISGSGLVTYKNQVFTNTQVGVPAVLLNTTSLVTFDKCTFNSSGDAIDSAIPNAAIIVKNGCVFNCTTPATYTPGTVMYLDHPSYFQFMNSSTYAGTQDWGSGIHISGLTSVPTSPYGPVPVGFVENNSFSANSRIVFYGLDTTTDSATEEIIVSGNTWTNPINGNLIFVQNVNSAPAMTFQITGNGVQTTFGNGPFSGFYGLLIGAFQTVSFNPTGNGQELYMGLHAPQP